MELAAVGSQLWTVSDVGLEAVDMRTGRAIVGPQTPYPYPVGVAASGGTLWIASVESGYARGAVTRIDARTRRASTAYRLPRMPVYDVCAGGGSAWAIVGPSRRRRLARLGRRTLFVRPGADPGWCAADRSGGWVATSDARLVHVSRTAAATTVAHVRGLGVLATGGGRVWATCAGGVARIDERSGTVAKVPIRGGRAIAVSAGPSAVWALVLDRKQRSWLVRVDSRTARVTARRRMAGSPAAVLEAGHALWVGGLDGRRGTVLLRVGRRSLVVRRAISLL